MSGRPRNPGSPFCSEAGCPKPARAKGLCHGHYQQQRRKSSPGVRLTDLPCGAPYCGRLAYKLGLCLEHWKIEHGRGPGRSRADGRRRSGRQIVDDLVDRLRRRDATLTMSTSLPEDHPVGVDALTATAHAFGLAQSDVIVLSDGADPYLAGRAGRVHKARWFKEQVWDRAGWVRGVHNRRAHYTAMSLQVEAPTNGGGRVYASGDNGGADFQALNDAARFARYEGLLDPAQFVDRRNSPATVNVEPRETPAEPAVAWTGEDVDDWSLPFIPARVLRADLDLDGGFEVTGYDYSPADQPALIEVWIEKSTMNDILEPLCRELGVNLVAGAGFESITTIDEMLRERVVGHGKHTHVLYVRDYDRAGEAMPVQVARQMQFWAQRYGIDVPLTVDVIALTDEQVDAYDLPRDPESDNRVELDALEALHPGALAGIVRDAVEACQDADHLASALAFAEEEAQETVDEQWSQDASRLRAEAAELKAEADAVAAGYSERLAALSAELDEELEPYAARLENLRERARGLVDDFDPELPERPEAEPVELDPDGPHLFDSRRHWLWQLSVFKAHQQNNKEQREINPAA